jgi:HK97 family phage major capsid protein
MNEELKKMLDEIKGTIDSRLDSMENKLRGVEMASGRLSAVPGLKDYTTEKFSLVKAIHAISTNDWSDAGFEKTVFYETQKTMSAGSDTAGGYIVPNEYISDIIEYLTHEVVAVKMGATVMENLTASPVEIPKQTGASTAYWVGENSSITDSELTFGQIAMTPKSCAAMVKLSNRLLRMSNPSVEALVRQDIATQLALAIDLAVIRGTGVENQPLGLTNTDGINTVVLGTSGGLPTFDTLMNMAYEVEIDHALTGKLAFMFHPAIRKLLAQLKVAEYSGDTAGGYVIAPPVSNEQLGNFIGYPFAINTQIPTTLTKGSATNCSEIYFGNWAQLLIGHWGGLQIMASEHTSTAFQTNQTWLRIIQDVDVAVRQPVAFCVCSDAKIA